MKKIEYLKIAVQNKLYVHKSWIYKAFSITKPKEQQSEAYGDLIIEPWGYSAVGSNGKEKIDDAVANEPLFRFKDKVKIDSSWATNLKEPIETTIGNLLFNHIAILSTFGDKFPYVTGKVQVSKLEDFIATKLQDTPEDESKRSNQYFYVDEYTKFIDALQYLSMFSQLTTWAATPKGIVAPTGIKEFKAQLIQKYEGKLHDPVELAKFEDELKAFDDEFLKDDPANGTFLAGKAKNVARKKMFLNVGTGLRFDNKMEVNPILSSLDEGWPTDPEHFKDAMNDLRAGSFSRGAETVKGGVSAKYLLRSANNFKIEDKDCGTYLGIRRKFKPGEEQHLTGRHVVKGNKSILVENNTIASNYLNQEIVVRSPMYCKLPGDSICRICAGERLFKYPNGLGIPLTEISSILLTASLKVMHGTVLSTAKMNLKEAFT